MSVQEVFLMDMGPGRFRGRDASEEGGHGKQGEKSTIMKDFRAMDKEDQEEPNH